MKKLILLVVLALAGVAAWYFWETKPKPNQEVAVTKPVTASQHSDAFNNSINSVMQAYYAVSESMVAWDSAAVATQTVQLKNRLDSLKLDELKNDSTTYLSAAPNLQKAQQQAGALVNAAGLEAKRHAFHSLSQNMYDLLRTIRYDAHTIYLQECPMAFNDDETGNWLSATAQIRNPYLGLHHPKYKGGMLECGETKDSLSFERVQ